MATKGYIDKDVYTLAKERVRRAYELFDTIVVSFSGGKDSTGCLQVVLEVAQELEKTPVECIFFDEEAIPYETEDYVRRMASRDDVNMLWLCNEQKTRAAMTSDEPYMMLWGEDVKEKWVREKPPEAVSHMPMNGLVHHEMIPYYYPPEEYGTVGMILGIRADESMSRFRSVTAKSAEQENYITLFNEDLIYCARCKKRMVRAVSKRMSKEGKTVYVHDPEYHSCKEAPEAYKNLYKVMPIYDWTDDDIWTAPRDFGWDYNKAYDLMEMAGLPRNHQRCSPAFAQEPLQKFWTYKVCFPEIWEKMIDRIDGANTALRYGLTPLYGHKVEAEKPEGKTWKEYIHDIITRIKDEKVRVHTAKQIQGMINLHFKKTGDEIAPHAPHPDSGVSWDYLAMIAMRTDLQGRKQPLTRVDNERYDSLRKNYEEDIKGVSKND
jgi:predicted phosphoadenosine phosphosulfate sulfurtransferase